MLFLIKFIVALLSSGIFLSGYETYRTKIIPPGPPNLEPIFLSNEAALYIFLAQAIAAFGIGVYLVYMFYTELKNEEGTPIKHIIFLSVLIVVSLHFSAPMVIIYAFTEMIGRFSCSFIAF